jgi:hypothetical protein
MQLNRNRAFRVNQLLRDYGTDNTDKGCLTDLLTDVRHWCDRHGHSYAELDRLAYQHYLAELHEERQP